MAETPQLLKTLGELVRELDALDAPYMLVGGIALAAWLPPRATADIDVAIAVEEEDLPALAKLIARKLGGVASTSPLRFKRGAVIQRVLVQRPEGEVMLDILPTSSAFLREAIGRRVRTTIPGLRTTYVATAEDLILMKLLAGRPQDLVDVGNLLGTDSIDRAHLARWAAALRVRTRLARMERRR